jgi:hypothetical protein
MTNLTEVAEFGRLQNASSSTILSEVSYRFLLVFHKENAKTNVKNIIILQQFVRAYMTALIAVRKSNNLSNG